MLDITAIKKRIARAKELAAGMTKGRLTTGDETPEVDYYGPNDIMLLREDDKQIMVLAQMNSNFDLRQDARAFVDNTTLCPALAQDVEALIAEVERLKADAKLGQLVRKVLAKGYVYLHYCHMVPLWYVVTFNEKHKSVWKSLGKGVTPEEALEAAIDAAGGE
jgi:NhaP-type Na+/H+ and K+/H+ antiporter